MIGEAQAKLIDYETRRAQGLPIAEAEISNEERRKEELMARRQALEEEIRHEVSLLFTEPKLLGVARVVPQSATPAEMRTDPEIELMGMHVAMAYERQQGRMPQDVSHQNLGYDIRSTAVVEMRYIEVKGRAGSGPIVLTPNEWLMAQRLGSEYWLYVVENAATNPALYLLRDPANALKPEEVKEVVRLVVRDWKTAAGPPVAGFNEPS